MDLIEENVINGNALKACLKYLEERKINLNDFDVRRYSSYGLYEYYMFVDHCDEFDPDCPIASMYSGIHMFAIQDENVVMHFSGFWISLKNFILRDSFLYHLYEVKKELGEKALTYKKTLFPELFKEEKEGFTTELDEAKKVLDVLEKKVMLDANDQYVFIGDEYEFIDSKDKMEHILATRHLLTRFIRLNFDIESATEDMRKYVSISKGNRLKKMDKYFYKNN